MTDFNEFYKLYPRHVGKLAAMKAWDKALRYAPASQIIAGLQAQLHELAAKDMQFIPHPTTWLNQGRWMDEPDTAPLPAHDRAVDTWSEKDWADFTGAIDKFGVDFVRRTMRYRRDHFAALELKPQEVAI